MMVDIFFTFAVVVFSIEVLHMLWEVSKVEVA